jgi:hypothetical protein
MSTPDMSSSYAYLAGLEAGRAMVDPGPTMARVRAYEQGRLARERRDAASDVRRLDQRRGWREAELGAASARHAGRDERLQELEDEQDDKPSAYSPVRGTIYILFAIAILLADFAILSQVIARVFKFTQRDLELGDPAGALFRNPIRAFEAFGEIYLTTLGVLLIAMAFKVWNDRKPRKRLDPDAPFVERVSRFFEDYGFFAVLAVALAAVVLVAVVRLVVDVRGDLQPGEELLRWVTALVGLACPFVGVLLFSRGLDAVGARYRLRIVRKHAEQLAGRATGLRKEWEQHSQDHVDRELKYSLVSSPDTERQCLLIAEDQFRLGYAAGVTVVLQEASPRGAYRTLRTRFPTR